MAGRVKGNRSGAAPLAPEEQRDLLRHGAAWHEDRRRLAQHPGDLVLEVLDQLARAVDIALFLGARLRRQRRQLVTHREAPMARERALAAREQRHAVPFLARLLLVRPRRGLGRVACHGSFPLQSTSSYCGARGALPMTHSVATQYQPLGISELSRSITERN
jgi:hypothetical protein